MRPRLPKASGHAERDDQHRRHRPEHDQPHRALLGVDDAGQPGVADPGPPEHPEHQQSLGQPRPGRVVGHQRRALGDREDEDEVEEELQRRHPLALAPGGARGAGVRAADGTPGIGAHPCNSHASGPVEYVAAMSVALVTGASTGIGEATAIRLAREPGTELVLVARREELLRELAESLPCRATYLAVDLTDAEAPGAGPRPPRGRARRPPRPARQQRRRRLARQLRRDRLRQRPAPHGAQLRRRRPPHRGAAAAAARPRAPSAIVNVASTAGRVSRARTGAYSASKFALIGWTDSLYAEELPHGVHVGMVLPGFVATEGFPADRAARESAHPLGRLQAGEGRRGDLRGRARRQGRALRAAPLRARRGRPHPRPAPGPPRPQRRRRRRPDHQHRRR